MHAAHHCGHPGVVLVKRTDGRAYSRKRQSTIGCTVNARKPTPARKPPVKRPSPPCRGVLPPYVSVWGVRAQPPRIGQEGPGGFEGLHSARIHLLIGVVVNTKPLVRTPLQFQVQAMLPAMESFLQSVQAASVARHHIGEHVILSREDMEWLRSRTAVTFVGDRLDQDQAAF